MEKRNSVDITAELVGCYAWHRCNQGLPLFSISYLFVILNLTLVGYGWY